MCTALTLTLHDTTYFGRNLDLDKDFGQEVVVTPRGFDFQFTHDKTATYPSALIGAAVVMAQTPMYFEATNEYGLSMAGLNFPGNAVFHKAQSGALNIAAWELIPYVLRTFRSVDEAERGLTNAVITDQQVAPQISNAPLHWIIADATGALVLESQSDGLHIYRNPWGVLTNNPPFPFHRENLKFYQQVTDAEPTNRVAAGDLTPPGVGYGSFGLPGDTTPASRFVNTVFLRQATLRGADVVGEGEYDAVSHYFQIMQHVGMVRGGTRNPAGEIEYTVYTSCCDATHGVYYYTTYHAPGLHAVRLADVELDTDALHRFPMTRTARVAYHGASDARHA